ncbi:MAG: reactive intermediate/imine deaminase [Actinobacteria bacterium 69-20]|jgi:reactive intermediate/imine deaminase|nr:RidA family protein [Actinomycetota bacterium]OJV27820.1 MAG: reactive intermediate/imine deaminase [Actinobacteria bacterium 69-20]
MAHRYAFTSQDAPTPGGAYSQAIGTDEIVWTAGLGPQHPVTGEIVGSDVTEQTHQVLRNLRAVLAAAGCEFKDVVKTTVHLSDLHRDFREFDAVYREYFTAPYPARTTVGSDLYGILVEIDVVAVRPA